ncbi:unnamed protein product [Alopecurus aequalis]
MAPRSLALLGALLAAAFLCTSSSAAPDAPFLVAHKKVALARPSPGLERLTVSLDIYNQGSATAYDVSINDDSWPVEAFQIVSGEVSKTLERLDPGSTASHVFVLETKTKGKFQGSPSVIKYRVATKAALQEAYSTPILPLDILAERPPVQKFEWKLVAKYGALVSVVSFVLAFIYLVASPSKSGGTKGGKKRR